MVPSRVASVVTLSIALAACTPRGEIDKGGGARSAASASAPAPSAAPPNSGPPSVVTIAAPLGGATHLAVFLHGVGADAASFQDLARTVTADFPHMDALVPDGFHPFDRAPSGRQWFSLRGMDEASRAPRVRAAGLEVSAWIDGELARRGLGGDRLVVVGFSQGAMLAGWLAVHRTPRPAAVVMLSGLVAEADAPPAEGNTKPAPPVFVAHGDHDDVIPVAAADAAARTLGAFHARVTTRIYPGMAHRVSAEELADVKQFLKSSLAP